MKNVDIVRTYKSRGYSGYYEIKGKKYFCRSSVEFVYLLYLYKIYVDDRYRIEMEDKIFYCDDYSYKPDFFVYENEKLTRIIEIKYNKRQIEVENNENRYKSFLKYFNKISIQYDIVYKNDINLKEFPDIKIELEKWKKENINGNILDGEKNPMWGRKHSEKTKKLIGDKTRERCKDSNYLKKFKKSVKKTDEQKDKCRKSALARESKKREIKLLNDPLEKRNCVICNKEFIVNKSSVKVTCKSSCTFKYNYKLGLINLKNNDPEGKSNKKLILKFKVNKK